jgi:hypothetical protein
MKPTVLAALRSNFFNFYFVVQLRDFLNLDLRVGIGKSLLCSDFNNSSVALFFNFGVILKSG